MSKNSGPISIVYSLCKDGPDFIDIQYDTRLFCNEQISFESRDYLLDDTLLVLERTRERRMELPWSLDDPAWQTNKRRCKNPHTPWYIY